METRQRARLHIAMIGGPKPTEQLKEFALAQQLRNILAMEQEHAMDLRQALGK